MAQWRLLLVEDDRVVRVTVRDALEDAGYAVTACEDGTKGLAALEAGGHDLVLTDVRLPGVDGLSLFRHARRLHPDVPVVLMTAHASTEDAVAVMREGARDYLLKPFELDELLLRLGRIRSELDLRRAAESGAPLGEARRLRGSSAAMRGLRERVEAAAASDVPVLITGETGTGKDVCARAIHESGARARRPFVAVNCGAIPEALFEAEFFGHEKGAFTGADRKRIGRFEAADGGTLFLDEVGELSRAAQVKLLRVLEQFSFEPVGSSRSVRVDVRVIAATNRDLRGALEAGTFRRDLFYRLNVIDLHTPALRERREDLPGLVADLLAELSTRQGRPAPALEPDAAAALAAHDYPGNVRELLHALERAVALSRGAPMRLAHLPEEIAAGYLAIAAPAGRPGEPALEPLVQAVGAFERAYIEKALESVGGHRTKAAALLGISRKSLWQRLRADVDDDDRR